MSRAVWLGISLVAVVLLPGWLVPAAPAGTGELSGAARRLVEEDWQRQDEGRLREIREPGLVRFAEAKLSWPGAGGEVQCRPPRLLGAGLLTAPVLLTGGLPGRG